MRFLSTHFFMKNVGALTFAAENTKKHSACRTAEMLS
jgi:hypothetical protein